MKTAAILLELRQYIDLWLCSMSSIKHFEAQLGLNLETHSQLVSFALRVITHSKKYIDLTVIVNWKFVIISLFIR